MAEVMRWRLKNVAGLKTRLYAFQRLGAALAPPDEEVGSAPPGVEAGLQPRSQEVRMAWLRLLLVMLATLPLAACELAGDIFEAGVWVGVIMIAIVVAIIAWVVAKIRT